MKSKLVHVEIDETGLPCRIFRNKDWRKLPSDLVLTMTKAEAVGAIRLRVYHRSRHELTDAECERCGRHITWDTMEMNEKKLKSLGGEVSMENCEALCASCHRTGPDAHHGDRRWQSAKIKSEEGQ